LYWATRLLRIDCEFGSATGAAAVRLAKGVAEPPMAPIVDEAALFAGRDADLAGRADAGCRLFAANAVLSWLSVETWPAPVPNEMLVAVPLPVAAIVSVWPVIAGE